MRTEDLNSDRLYATCDGERLELVEPVHARWAKVESDGNKPHRFVQLDDDALPGKRTDPWGKCHRNQATVGVRARRWGRDAIDRDGKVRKGSDDYAEVVVAPVDIAGTWADYLVLHGAVVRKHADSIDEKHRRKLHEQNVADAIVDLLGVEPGQVSLNSYRDWMFSVKLDDAAVDALSAHGRKVSA